ncbi:hypothetical protein KIK84_04755 [Curvibacter sp. CHRR-16]|uniref:hypothetical protein n=1 Tax=Curvibacter sp. CHRR-16 TaxID=2835872 RepID=UPI001BD9D99B|nr:hypothetical protein [Curvibacter sp. CHRR-16]MBT0569623.1 hypothetical protein [Curvibacter sp. CHRR-16]
MNTTASNTPGSTAPNTASDITYRMATDSAPNTTSATASNVADANFIKIEPQNYAASPTSQDHGQESMLASQRLAQDAVKTAQCSIRNSLHEVTHAMQQTWQTQAKLVQEASARAQAATAAAANAMSNQSASAPIPTAQTAMSPK